MLLRNSGLALVLALAACPPPASVAPVGPPRPQPAQAIGSPGLHAPWPSPRTADPAIAQPVPADPNMPVDPRKPMPARSISTNAALDLGKPATVMVDGRADIFSAGLAAPDQHRGGKLPALLTLLPGGGYVTFSSVRGVIGCAAGATTPPDGGDCAGGNTDIRAASGISGIIDHQRTQFLVGVYLGTSASTKAPATLDFSANERGDSFAELAPAIGQTFYIGDGFTKSGLNQRFTIPAGATRFYLAFADAIGFQGDPGSYGDNTGGLSVTLTQAK